MRNIIKIWACIYFLPIILLPSLCVESERVLVSHLENEAVKIIEIDTSGGDSSPLNSTINNDSLAVLDYRINELRKDVDDKTVQVYHLENEIRSTIREAIPLLGESFFEKLENDEVWINVESQEYIDKYMDHMYPVISVLAGYRRTVHDYNLTLTKKKMELEFMAENRLLFNMLPLDMYRKIQTERSYIQTLLRDKEEVKRDLDHLRQDYELVVSEMWRDSLIFSSVESFTTDGGVLVNKGLGGWDTVLGSNPLHDTSPSYWAVEMRKVPKTGLSVGVSAVESLSGKTFHDPSTFAFSTLGRTYQQGVTTSSAEWPGWVVDDVVVFKYSPVEGTLAAHHSRSGRVYTLRDIPPKKHQKYRMYLCLYSSQSSVRLRTATTQQRALFLTALSD